VPIRISPRSSSLGKTYLLFPIPPPSFEEDGNNDCYLIPILERLDNDFDLTTDYLEDLILPQQEKPQNKFFKSFTKKSKSMASKISSTRLTIESCEATLASAMADSDMHLRPIKRTKGLPTAPPPSPMILPKIVDTIPFCPEYEEASTLGPWDTPSMVATNIYQSDEWDASCVLDCDESWILPSYYSSGDSDSESDQDEMIPWLKREYDYYCPPRNFHEEIEVGYQPNGRTTGCTVPLSSPSYSKTSFESEATTPPTRDYLSYPCSYFEWDNASVDTLVQPSSPVAWIKAKTSQVNLRRRASAPDTVVSKSELIKDKAGKIKQRIDRVFGGKPVR